MIRLLVNVPPHKAGSRITADHLDSDFVQRLLDAGQAEEVPDETPPDPTDLALCEVFELEDQIDAAISRRARVVMLIDGLDEGGRTTVERALATATRVRPELFGMDVLPDTAFIVATEQGFTDVAEMVDRATIGRALLEALPEGFDYSETPVEIMTVQKDRIAVLESEIRDLERQAESAAAVLAQAEDEVHRLQAELTARDREAASDDADPPSAEPEGRGKTKPKA